MSEKTKLEEFKADYDWQSAFQEAVGDGYRWFDGEEMKLHPINNVTEVHHSYEGCNDEESWIAIVGWSGPEGNFATIDAGCDYTGWD